MFRKNSPEALEQKQGEDEATLLYSIHRYSILLLALLTVGCSLAYSGSFALSILLGGLLVNGSFIMLRRDATRFMDDFVRAGENQKGIKRMFKVRFLLRFYTRLAVLGIIIYLLSLSMQINMVGLAVGLSTVMVSVIAVVLSKRSLLFSMQRYKGV